MPLANSMRSQSYQPFTIAQSYKRLYSCDIKIFVDGVFYKIGHWILSRLFYKLKYCPRNVLPFKLHLLVLEEIS